MWSITGEWRAPKRLGGAAWGVEMAEVTRLHDFALQLQSLRIRGHFVAVLESVISTGRSKKGNAAKSLFCGWRHSHTVSEPNRNGS